MDHNTSRTCRCIKVFQSRLRCSQIGAKNGCFESQVTSQIPSFYRKPPQSQSITTTTRHADPGQHLQVAAYPSSLSHSERTTAAALREAGSAPLPFALGEREAAAGGTQSMKAAPAYATDWVALLQRRGSTT